MSDETQILNQLTKLLDSTSQVNIKLQHLVVQQDKLDERLGIMIKEHNTMATDIALLKQNNFQNDLATVKTETTQNSRDINELKSLVNNHKGKWDRIIDNLWKIGGVIVGAIILYKLGIKS